MSDDGLTTGFDVDDLSIDYLPPEDGPAVESVQGDDESAFWQAQDVDGLCAPTSAAMVISEFADRLVAKDDVAQVAAEHGLLTYGPDGWHGMTADETAQLLDLYGISCHVEHGDLDTLSGYLADNRGVILAVDSGEIWGLEPGDGGGTGADHALLVTAIDDSRGVAILNDPGEPDGAGQEVPLAVLQDAWADSGNLMVATDAAPDTAATDAAPDTAATDAAPAGADTDDGGVSGWVILPVALVAGGAMGAWLHARATARRAAENGPRALPPAPPLLRFGSERLDV